MEIGSEFWDVPVTNDKYKLFNESVSWFLSGRISLRAIIKDITKNAEVHTVAMPSWCCHSMLEPFWNAGLDIKFYPVYFQEEIVQRVSLEADVLLVMDYFGYTGRIPDLSSYKGIVVRDVTHSIFSATYSDADYYFGSLRKWCGVWSGGYAWMTDGRKLVADDYDDQGYADLRMKAMELKYNYINSLKNSDKGYLEVFDEAEEMLNNVRVVSAAERDIQLAHKLNVEYIKNKRRKNAEILRDAFPKWIVFREMKHTDCPMFVPIIVPNGKRDELRRHLMEKEIYCPIHWPVSNHHHLDKKEMFIYQNELSLVCDQRYNREDMWRIIDVIRDFMEG